MVTAWRRTATGWAGSTQSSRPFLEAIKKALARAEVAFGGKPGRKSCLAVAHTAGFGCAVLPPTGQRPSRTGIRIEVVTGARWCAGSGPVPFAYWRRSQ